MCLFQKHLCWPHQNLQLKWTPECRPTYALVFFVFFSSLLHLFFCCLKKINLYTCLSHTLFNFFLLSFLKHFILVSLNFMWRLIFLISSLTCFIIQFFPVSLRTTFFSSSSCLIQVPHYHIDDIFWMLHTILPAQFIQIFEKFF